MQSSSVISASPSFTGHSSNNLADIAARVVQEFRQENGDDDDDIFNFNDYGNKSDDNQLAFPGDDEADVNSRVDDLKDDKDDSDGDDDEFEFAVVRTDVDSSLISADEIFSGGQILPRYPLFDRSLLLDVDPDSGNGVDRSAETDSKPSPVVRLPLRKLFNEERDSASCSSSEADDLEGVSPETYCVWRPKAESPGACKKSNSTGNTSKRWKLRGLLHRSNSDGNITADKAKPFALFTPLIATKSKEKMKKVEKTAKVAAAVVGGGAAENTPSNKATNGGSRHRSYLPYRPELVGVFVNVNGNRNRHPF